MTLTLLLLACGLGEPTDPAVDVFFPAARGTAVLRIEAAADAGSPGKAWAEFLDRLFDFFDRDGDGRLSRDEAGRVIPMPLAGGGEFRADFTAMDTDRDDWVSRPEFRAFYRRAGFPPVISIVHTPDEPRRLSESLFRHLDRDGDRTISPAEWKRAPDVLRRLDENEDEVLEPAEVLTRDQQPSWPPRSGVRFKPAAAAPDATVRVDLGTTQEVCLLTDTASSVRGPGPAVWRFSGGVVRIGLDGIGQRPWFRPAKEFYLAQFAEALGEKRSVSRDEVTADPGLRAVAALFDAADRDGDGRLTPAELRQFLDLVELGVGCQTVVAVEDRGPSLFDLVDANADGRLDVAELTAATRQPAVSREQVTGSYRVVISRRTQASRFGPVPLPAASPMPEVKRVAVRAGPRWFRAMDANGDGYVSAAEFRGSPALFARLDRDGDGRLSPEEAGAGNPP